MADNTVKAKITTGQGSFEFEGPQAFVEQQINKIVEIEKQNPTRSETQIKPAGKTPIKSNAKNGSPRKTSIEQPKMLTNLITKEQIAEIKKFYESKSPKSHIEKFAVLTYWLKLSSEHPTVSINEMWTLYKILQIRAPKALIQTFRDGKSKKAYFESTDNPGYYSITSVGETFVEHDLPGTVEKK